MVNVHPSWTPLLLRTATQGTLVTTFINRPNLTLWKSELAVLLIPFPSLRPENSSFCDHCAQGRQHITHQSSSVHKKQVQWGPPLLAHSPAVSGIPLSHIPKISWTLSSLLDWISCRYLVSWRPTMRMRTTDTVTSPNVLSTSSSWLGDLSVLLPFSLILSYKYLTP